MKSNQRLRLRRPTTLSLINNGRASHQHPLVWFLDTLPRSSGSPAALQRPPRAGQRHAPWPTLQSCFRPPLLEPQEPHRRQPGALLLLLLLPANGCRGPDLWGPDRGILETTGGSSGTPASRNKAHKGTHPPPRGLLAGRPVLSASPSTRVGANTVPASTADWTRRAGDSLSEVQTLQPARSWVAICHTAAGFFQRTTAWGYGEARPAPASPAPAPAPVLAVTVDSLVSLRNHPPANSIPKQVPSSNKPRTQPIPPRVPPHVARSPQPCGFSALRVSFGEVAPLSQTGNLPILPCRPRQVIPAVLFAPQRRTKHQTRWYIQAPSLSGPAPRLQPWVVNPCHRRSPCPTQCAPTKALVLPVKLTQRLRRQTQHRHSLHARPSDPARQRLKAPPDHRRCRLPTDRSNNRNTSAISHAQRNPLLTLPLRR